METRWIRVALAALLIVVMAAGGVWVWGTFHGSATASEEEDQEAVVYHGTTACGVERWWVKTGIDSAARRVDTKHIVSTNIIHLRSLPAPSSLPSRSRIGPTELTVFQVQARLLRVKEEADSDYHLVLSDSGGRTMIAEIPSPACVGSKSPWTPQLNYVRRTFTAKFHPGTSWERGSWPVTVTGVGFFDFKHGQSGVAPNAIELHPVLAIRYGTGGTTHSTTPPPPPSSKPTPKPAGTLHLSVGISPNPVPYGAHPVLTVVATPGASCAADVVYSTGRRPVSFDGSAQRVGSSGQVSWTWHMESSGSSGTATVTCSLKGKSASQAATFGITH